MPRVPFAINTSAHDSPPVSAQRLVNWFAEIQPVDAKTRVVLRPWPGLKSFTTVGTGPIRGRAVMNGVLYIVSGTKLHSVDASGTATEIGSIGTNATGIVPAAHNGTQLVIINDNDGYVYDRLLNTLTQITDADFQKASAVNYLDGYHIFVQLNTDTFFISANDDPTSYSALDFATAEGSPDLLVNIAVNARQLLLFGEETIEPWYNSGDTFPFDRLSGAYIERGLGAKNSIISMDNSVFWLGDDLKVYRLDGFTPTRISSHAVEQAIAGYSGAGDAEGNTISYEGHEFYVLTFPGQGTHVYDAATRLWHDRQTYGQDDFRACCFAKAYGKVIAGDRNGNALYTIDADTYDDAGSPLVRKAIGAPYYANGRTARMGSFEAIFDTGVGLTTGQGSDPQAMLRYSDDAGRTWSPELWRDIGAIGDYSRLVEWHRLGAFEQRIIELSVSDPIKSVLLGANAEIEA